MLLCFYAFYIIVVAVSRYVYVKINKTAVITENEEIEGKNGNKKADASEKHLQGTESIEDEEEEKPEMSRQLTNGKVRLTCNTTLSSLVGLKVKLNYFSLFDRFSSISFISIFRAVLFYSIQSK